MLEKSQVKPIDELSIGLRKATVEDCDAIMVVQKNDGYPHSYYLTKERLQKLFDRNEEFYVVTAQDGRIIAFFAVNVEIRAHLHFFSVHKDFQRRHIGSYIMRQLLDGKMLGDARVLYAYVDEGAEKIRKFLIQNGFEEAGYYRNRFGPNKNAIIMEHRLE